MNTEYFTLYALTHPPLRPQTYDAMLGLDPIRDAMPGDAVAVSVSYRLEKNGLASQVGDSKTWIISKLGIEAVSIFDVLPVKVPPASIAMIHAKQDTVLNAVGMQVGEILGEFPDQTGGRVDLICLNTGVVALRRLPDLTRTRGNETFRTALPHVAAPFVPAGLSVHESLSVSYDLSVFLSKAFSTKPKIHLALGNTDPVPETTITIQPPGR